MFPKLSQALAALWLFSACLGVEGASDRPNIVFILTDDQDAHMESLAHMPQVQKYLVDEGTRFVKHYCTVAICCPSRVSLWTGQMPHNTNVTNVQPPWGGYPKFIEGGYNEHHLALWMQESGYNTYYAGKLFNGHTVNNYNSPAMSGYTGSEFFLEPFTYQYFNISSTRNGQTPHNPIGNYSTDLIAEYGGGFLDEALEDSDNPFFLTLAPVAPHGFLTEWPEERAGPPQVADRHKGLFTDYKIPRSPNFNPDSPSGVNWVNDLPKLNDTVIDYNDEYQRLRLRALRAVDEMVGGIIERLDEAGVLDNTYIFYSSDNGFHISQHRMHPGKMCGYETDINVPMVVRGPGIPAKGYVRAPSSHTDLAPTIMQLAGNDIDDKAFDGTPIDLSSLSNNTRTEHAGVEFWGIGLGESPYGATYVNNTYKGLRIVAEDYGFYYSVWCNNAKELYNMKEDEWQLNNLLADEDTSGKTMTLWGEEYDLELVADRLDAVMMVIKACKEDECRDPWGTLHPGGQVQNFADAMDSSFDDFYREQTKVSYTQCERGYILSSEGPQEWQVFGEDVSESQRRLAMERDWSLWE